MFKPTQSGDFEIIQGLKCYLPKVGYIWNPFVKDGKGAYELDGLHRRSTNKNSCWWEKDYRWAKVAEWEEQEAARKKGNPDYKHPEYEAFKKQCWIWRLSGYWFNNNGTPTYITGHHWYFLSCYQRDDVEMLYKETDREVFYFWQYCLEDPQCFGMVESTKRRQGKTSRTGCVGLDFGTRIPNATIGIQSKTDDDAKEAVFEDAIVEPYRTLPNFFKPITNLPPSGKVPANELKFFSGKMSTNNSELKSKISFKSSSEKAYDGKKLFYIILDEEGKTKPQNVYIRWQIVKFCLKDSFGKIIGKSWHTSTVEEMESGGGNFLLLWQDSNHHEGRPTASGLYRYFLAADRARHVNRYGVPDVETSRREILMEREAQTNPVAKAALIRKEPLTEDEAFMTDGEKCIYNPLALAERLSALRAPRPKQYKRGNFAWVNGEVDGDVCFIENPNGRFQVMCFPSNPNQYQMIGSSFRPLANHEFSAGVDPYDNRQVEKSHESRMSDGSIVIKKELTPANPDPLVEGNLCCLYLSRPSPDVFYEDVIKVLKFYGCDALIENQKPGLLKHMEDRGYLAYAYHIPGREAPGIPSSSAQINYMVSITEQFIDSSINGVYFPELVKEWISFDPNNTQPSDAAMAFGYCETRSRIKSNGKGRTNKSNAPDIQEIFGLGSFSSSNYRLKDLQDDWNGGW